MPACRPWESLERAVQARAAPEGRGRRGAQEGLACPLARLGLGEGISWLFASLALPSWPPRLRGGSGASRGGRGEPEGLLLVGSCPSPHWLGSLVAPEQGACWTCRGLGRRARSGLGGNMAPFLSHLAYVPQSILDSIAVLRMATCAHLCCGCRPVCSEDPTRPHGWKAEGKASFQPPPPPGALWQAGRGQPHTLQGAVLAELV